MQVLDGVQGDLDSLSSCCDRMNALVVESKAGSADLLADLDKLQRALETSRTRSVLVTQFLDQYQLSPQQMQALQVGTGRTRRDVLWLEALQPIAPPQALRARCNCSWPGLP